MFKPVSAALVALAMATPAQAKDSHCGAPFSSFVKGLKREAMQMGFDKATTDRFFASVAQDPKVIRADRAQGVFTKTFTEFSRMLISQNRITNGQRNLAKWKSVFDRIERDYGVSRGVLTAFWAFETDYGGFQGDFNTLNALVTLAHDCRRPELFRPQIFSALELYTLGDFSPTKTTGAWAGEIGMVQMLPGDIVENGVDGDGDGHVNLKTSPPDALMSGAKMLSALGWRANEPWLQEVVVPGDLDWSKTGIEHAMSVSQWQRAGVRARQGKLGPGNLKASIILPQGRHGPAFIAYPNFKVYFEWNQSFIYVLTAGYFANRLEGAAVFDPGNPEPGLSGSQMKALQKKLAARGHDVGKIDGILGAGTRAAVQKEQKRLGLPADAWPTVALLNRL